MKKVHTISINSEEEEEEHKITINVENFSSFCFWLRQQSEKKIYSIKYWEKTIFKKLMGGDKMTLENYYEFLQEREKLKSKLLNEHELEKFDYSIIINKKVTIENKKKIILNYIDTGAFLHIFYDDKTDALISKEEIRHSFKLS